MGDSSVAGCHFGAFSLPAADSLAIFRASEFATLAQ
jgi:hypothetical protein